MANHDGDGVDFSFVLQSPSTSVSLRSVLIEAFENDSSYDHLRILAATVSEVGIQRIEDYLREFCDEGSELDIYVGLSMGPDSNAIRLLKDIQEAYPERVSLRLIENGDGVELFHPKVYWFQSESSYYGVVGSANWSRPGMEGNVEAMSIFKGTTSEESEPPLVQQVKSAFQEISRLNISEDSWGRLHLPSEEILEQLEETGNTSTEGTATIPQVDIEVGEVNSLWPLTGTAPELVMELHRESRMSQIVPPNTVWEEYFNVDPASFRDSDPDLPTFELRNVETDEVHERPVVDHDHQGTIEISEAEDRDDPSVQSAFLVFRRTGPYSFDYQLFLEGEDVETDQIEEFLSDRGHRPGRTTRLIYTSI